MRAGKISIHSATHLALAALLSLTGCSCDDEETGPTDAGMDGSVADGSVANGKVPCVDNDPRCGSVCGPGVAVCPFGLHCQEGLCARECTGASFEKDCGAGRICAPDGRCIAVADSSMTECSSTLVENQRVTPTVVLIVDQSGSMTTEFDMGVDRWNALRDFLLLTPGGLIADLQDQVRFGLALYSAQSTLQELDGGVEVELPSPGTECPMMTIVPPVLDNYANIEMVYAAAEPIEDTPTGEAIDAVVEDLGLDALGQVAPDGERPDPVIFILATDGEPDHCGELDPQNGQPQAIAAAGRAFDLGIRTFVISVGEGVVSDDHLQDMANQGVGHGAGDPNAEFWVAGDDATLRDALLSIVNGNLSCEVALNGRVQPDDACKGTVTLGGTELPCNDDNGWRLLDRSTIELQGDACDRLKSSGDDLSVVFPCGVEIEVF